MRSSKFLKAKQAPLAWDVPGLVAGVDEAGRGPLAGPVVAAAVILDDMRPIRGLADSKTLTPKQREGVEIDYGMKNGKVTVPCRQAMLFYTLRTLNFEPNGTPRNGEKQVVIANLAEIKPFLPKAGQA